MTRPTAEDRDMNIRLDDVTVTFGARTIGPVTTTIGPGITWLAAPSGAGKSTLIRLISGEVRCRMGRVSVGDRDPFADAATRARIGTLTTHPDLPGFLTVDDAWRWFAAVRGAATWDGAPWRDALGLPGELRLGTASAGERQRAELLAAIAGDPPVLLLDEPFSHLDVASAQTLANWLDGWRTRTVLLTGHAELPVRPDRPWRPFEDRQVT
jgi:ABC-2 type transport system ATP-binding protein